MEYKTLMPRANFHCVPLVHPLSSIYDSLCPWFVLHGKHSYQGITKRCRLSLRTNSAPRIRVQMQGDGGGEGGVAGSQPVSTAVHIT
jgi:hypothetical protein